MHSQTIAQTIARTIAQTTAQVQVQAEAEAEPYITANTINAHPVTGAESSYTGVF